MARRRDNRTLCDAVRGDNARGFRAAFDADENIAATCVKYRFTPLAMAIEPGDVVTVRLADSIGYVHLQASF
jgi:hypothetical protein